MLRSSRLISRAPHMRVLMRQRLSSSASDGPSSFMGSFLVDLKPKETAEKASRESKREQGRKRRRRGGPSATDLAAEAEAAAEARAVLFPSRVAALTAKCEAAVQHMVDLNPGFAVTRSECGQVVWCLRRTCSSCATRWIYKITRPFWGLSSCFRQVI